MLNFLEFFFYNGNFNKPQKYELFRANTLPLLHPANVGVCDVTSPFRYLRSSILIYFIHDYLVVFSFPNTRRIFFFFGHFVFNFWSHFLITECVLYAALGNLVEFERTMFTHSAYR